MADGEPKPKPDAALVKKIRIQTGVVKRVAKEKLLYAKQTEKETEEVTKMEAAGKDSHDIKKRCECRDESKNMIKVVGRQLVQEHGKLIALKGEAESDKPVKGTDEYKKMLEVLEEAKTALAHEDY